MIKFIFVFSILKMALSDNEPITKIAVRPLSCPAFFISQWQCTTWMFFFQNKIQTCISIVCSLAKCIDKHLKNKTTTAADGEKHNWHYNKRVNVFITDLFPYHRQDGILFQKQWIIQERHFRAWSLRKPGSRVAWGTVTVAAHSCCQILRF